MAPIREALKVMQGAVLVAREAAISSQRLQHLRSGDVRSFLVSLVNSITDLTGLTSGHPRPYSPQDPPTTVVYFPHSTDSDSDSKDNNDPSSSIAPDQAAGAASESAIPSTSQSDASSSRAIPDRDDAKIKARKDIPRREPRERSVPTTSIGRAIGFAGLGAGLAWGTVQESAKRIIFGNNNSITNHQNLSPLLSDQNAERLASTLCRMRGAALKAGQMLSIQDESLIPEPLLSALEAVRQGADIMPRKQLDKVLAAELGPDWQTKLKVFDYKPLASASIGQVHKAVTRNDLEIAMKIQYPGVAESIDSDIENVRRLLQYTNLIPKGLFLDQAMKVAKVELARECDYILEAENQKRYHKLLYRVEGFYVPRVIDEISSKRVLSTELVTGVSVEKVAYLKQETRDYVGRKLLELTLKELFEFRFMQTDPNWGNFLYDEEKNVINLIDFGAAREYRKQFVDDYLRMVFACADRNKEEVIKMSCRLGFLTGEESEIMLDAHSKAAFIVGLPFSKPGLFDFKSANVTGDISGLGATMLKHRMKPPPDEVYSLHRKLSGAFLACIKLGAVVPCRDMLLDVYHSYNFSDLETDQMVSTGVA